MRRFGSVFAALGIFLFPAEGGAESRSIARNGIRELMEVLRGDELLNGLVVSGRSQLVPIAYERSMTS